VEEEGEAWQQGGDGEEIKKEGLFGLGRRGRGMRVLRHLRGRKRCCAVLSKRMKLLMSF
jgi:hypothetical protein